MTSSLAPAPACADASPPAARPRWTRRAAFVLPVAGATLLGLWLAAVATEDSHSVLRPALLGLAALNILYMALTGWPFLLGLLARGRATAMRPPCPSGRSATAVVMPVYNESPRAVFAAMETMAQSIATAGLRGVDLFVLSDTRDPAIAALEQDEFDRLSGRLGEAGPRLLYRRRADNTGRKVGNLLDFCSRWGEDYDYMLVLDADSLMGASAIERLIGLMDANPRAGIIQTVPYAVGRETPFARFQQFGARLYAPLLVEGLTFWQQSDGNYWGHNAIIRIRPFLAHCKLPVLPGREPFGGEILCHDVVEAGLMRAAGWEVWDLAETLESYEAVPANLVDFTGRERRWCQGNLQHAALLRRRGLRGVGRFHLAYGIGHYLAGPAAALFLLLATVDTLIGGDFARRLLLEPNSAAIALAALSAALLYAGKLAGLVIALADPEAAAGFGGRARLLLSALLEQLGAFILSSVLVVVYTKFVAALLAGSSVRWGAQSRDDRGLSWAEAWGKFRLPTWVGLVWGGMLLAGDPALLWPASPLLLGLLAGAPAAWLSSRPGVGAALRRLRLFQIPEETAPPAILRAYRRLERRRTTAAAPMTPAGLQLADAD